MNEQPKMAKQQAAQVRAPEQITLSPRPDGNLWLGGFLRVSYGTVKERLTEFVHVLSTDEKTACKFTRDEAFDLVRKADDAAATIEKLEAKLAQSEPDQRIAALATELEQKAAAADALRTQGTAGALFAQQAVAYRDAAALLRLRFAIPANVEPKAP